MLLLLHLQLPVPPLMCGGQKYEHLNICLAEERETRKMRHGPESVTLACVQLQGMLSLVDAEKTMSLNKVEDFSSDEVMSKFAVFMFCVCAPVSMFAS